MLATAPSIHNRIANHFAPVPLPVPETPEGKQAAWGDAVFAAALFFQARLAHPDPEVAERAARALFDLEKTRLRHGRDLAGATVPKPRPAADERLEPLPPLDPIEEPKRSPKVAERPEFMSKDLAVADAMVRMEKYKPLLDEMTAKLTAHGIDGDEARRLATEAFRREILGIIRERHERRAGFSRQRDENPGADAPGSPNGGRPSCPRTGTAVSGILD